MKNVVRLSVVISLLWASSSAWAVPTLDQYQENQDGGVTAHFGVSTMWIGQTFTAGFTGWLEHVELGNTFGHAALPVAAPVVQIRDTVAGEPGPVILGSRTASDPLPTDAWESVNFLAQNILLTGGRTYTLVIFPSEPSGNVTMGMKSGSASYGGGALWVYLGGAWQINSAWMAEECSTIGRSASFERRSPAG